MTMMQVFQGVEVVIQGEEPLILDTVLAEALGYSRPRDIRRLIKRFAPHLPGIRVRATVARTQMPTGGTREVTVTEYLLTEANAIYIAAKSNTHPANELLQKIIAAFLDARRFIQHLLLAPLDQVKRELEELRIMYREDMSRQSEARLPKAMEEILVRYPRLERDTQELADRVEKLEKVRNIKDAPSKKASAETHAYNRALDEAFGRDPLKRK